MARSSNPEFLVSPNGVKVEVGSPAEVHNLVARGYSPEKKVEVAEVVKAVETKTK